jgi:hypothetical protein
MKRVAVILTTMVVSLGLVPQAHASTWPRGSSYRTFREYRTSVHVVTVHLAKRSLRTMPAEQNFPMRHHGGSVPQLGKRYHAKIAINGDFKMKVDGYVSQPKHAWVKNREIWTTGVGRGGVGLVLNNRHHAKIGPTSILALLRDSDNRTHRIDRVNQGHEGVAVFTPRGGGTQHPVDGRCYVRLANQDGWSWNDRGLAQRTYTVQTAQCGQAIPVLDGTIVVESGASLDLAGPVTWTQNLGIKYATEVVAGVPQVLTNGNVTGPTHARAMLGPDGTFYDRNPRTAIGVNRKGTTLFLMAVDGRLHNQAGVTLPMLGRLMKRVGAYNAVNYDGGGGTLLWRSGKGILNNPSEHYARPALVGIGIF